MRSGWFRPEGWEGSMGAGVARRWFSETGAVISQRHQFGWRLPKRSNRLDYSTHSWAAREYGCSQLLECGDTLSAPAWF